MAVRGIRHQGQERQEETRYFISSLACTAEQALKAVRSHWAIENSLHWALDMSFGEDQSRIQKVNAPGNVAIIRHTALNMMRQAQPKRVSLKQMRKLAGWVDGTLENILKQAF